MLVVLVQRVDAITLGKLKLLKSLVTLDRHHHHHHHHRHEINSASITIK